MSLAIAVDFAGAGPGISARPRPRSTPFASGNFTGSVATGASANCSTITLTPHCQMTHTESVAHLTRESGDAWRVVPRGLMPAVVVSVIPEPARESSESTDPQPWGTDVLITKRRLRAAWPMATHGGSGRRRSSARCPMRPPSARATTATSCRRTSRAKRSSGWWRSASSTWCWTCPRWIARTMKATWSAIGCSSACRAGSTARGDAARSRATITELAFIPDEVSDGPCILALAVPAIGGDAVPSQPIVYPLAP